MGEVVTGQQREDVRDGGNGNVGRRRDDVIAVDNTKERFQGERRDQELGSGVFGNKLTISSYIQNGAVGSNRMIQSHKSDVGKMRRSEQIQALALIGFMKDEMFERPRQLPDQGGRVRGLNFNIWAGMPRARLFEECFWKARCRDRSMGWIDLNGQRRFISLCLRASKNENIGNHI